VLSDKAQSIQPVESVHNYCKNRFLKIGRAFSGLRKAFY